MLEKISRFLIILVFAISGLLIMEVASPFLSQFVSNEYLKVGFLGVTPLRLVLGLLGLVVFGSLGKWAAPFLMNLIMRFPNGWPCTLLIFLPVIFLSLPLA